MSALARMVWGAVRTLWEALFWLAILLFWPISIVVALWRMGRALEAIALSLDSIARSKAEHTASSQEGET